MKLEAKSFPRVLQISGSVAQHFTCFLFLLAFIVAGPFSTARAANKSDDAVRAIKQLAKQEHISAGDYSAAVAKLVKADPADASVLLAEAVKDKPPFACDVVKAGILALMPENGGPIDPRLVATVVATIVQTVQATDPDVIERVVSCALEVDKDAAPYILNALAGLYNGPHGINRPPGETGNGPVPGTGHTPTPKPTPIPSPTPVTPFKPI